MCGRIKRPASLRDPKVEGGVVIASLGKKLRVYNEWGEEIHVGKWNGFARSESLDTKWKDKLRFGAVPVESYEEHGFWFKIPEQTAIKVGILTVNTYYRPKGSVLMITREAILPWERRIHSRHPAFTRYTGELPWFH